MEFLVGTTGSRAMRNVPVGLRASFATSRSAVWTSLTTARERHQPLRGFGELHRLAASSDHRHTVERLQRLQLVRDGRLREVHAIRPRDARGTSPRIMERDEDPPG
jgi:hypothetical protein